MGKKRKSIKRESSQTEDLPKDEFINLNLNYLPAIIVVFASIGFCFGHGGSSSTLSLPLTEWPRESLSSIGGMVQSFKRFVLPFRFQESDEFNLPSPHYVQVDGKKIRDSSSHPLVFAALREAIIREGGFVHPDLGLMVPAPSGAHRGIGMVRDSYDACQTRCMPGTADEKARFRQNEKIHDKLPPKWNATVEEFNSKEKMRNVLKMQQSADEQFKQEEYLIKVPHSYQMTRNVALQTFLPMIPPDVQIRASFLELDDAALLVLLLAYERGRGKQSKFHPYIASLPVSPSCGYLPEIRSQALRTIELMAIELGMDVYGWPGEMKKASDRAQMIAEGLATNYGRFIIPIDGPFTVPVLQWALCQVASRAIAGSETFGSLRLVPMVDMVNHYVDAGGFQEILAEENSGHIGGNDEGAFVVRSLRHGRRRPLMKGQELLVNYNVPDYSPLDWFVSMGFVPPERMQKWQRVEGIFKDSRSFATN